MPRASAERLSPDPDPKRQWAVSGTALALAALLLGCKDNPADAPPDREHNPISPTANALISGHHVGGNPADRSSIYRILEVGDGTWIAAGVDNNVYSVRRLDADGVPLWTNHIESYRVRSVTNVTAPWLPLGAVSVGTSDSDADGQIDNSRVSAWGADGALLDEIVLAGGDLRRVAIDIAVTASSMDRVDFIVVGSASQADNTFVPWATRVSLRSDSTLARGVEHTDPAHPLHHLNTATYDMVSSILYVGGNVYDADESTVRKAFVMRLSDSLQVDWLTDLVAIPGLVTSLGALQARTSSGGGVIAVGATDAVKEEPPSNAEYWDAGLVASLSTAGAVQWLQSVTLSTKTDRFEACWLDGENIYAAGRAAAFHYADNDRAFGYGLLTRHDLMTGEMLAGYTFGDPGYGSGFNSVVVHGNRAWCAGYTERDILDRFRTWFTEIDFTRSAVPVVRQRGSPRNNRTATGHSPDRIRPPRRPDQPGVAP